MNGRDVLAISIVGIVLYAIAGVPPASGQFTRITSGHPVDIVDGSRGVTWIDTDGDGDLDLYVTNGGASAESNEYYRNDAGVFVRVTTSALTNEGIRDDGASWGDFDNDGDADLFTCSWHGEVNYLFENLGSGVFQRNPLGPTSYSEGCSWVDYDNDGRLDLYVANSGNSGLPVAERNNFLFHNDGGSFTRILVGPLVNDELRSRQPSWCDYDGDGDMDLFVANESGDNNRLYRNLLVETGTADFEDLAAGAVTSDGGNSWSASWGDFDNDGDFDLYVGNSANETNFFYRNELVETGTATLTRITTMDLGSQGGWAAGTSWADWDNDGDLDLLQTNGFHSNSGQQLRNWYYRNDAGIMNRFTFANGAPDDQGWGYGHSWGDYDGDGDLDLYTANWFQVAQGNFLYRNDAELVGNHWLQIDCVGTDSNKSGIGARVTVTALIDGSSVSQLRQVAGSDGHCSQNKRVHFGLGDATIVDIQISWPSGTVQDLAAVTADQVLTVVEPEVVAAVPVAGLAGELTASPNPFGNETALRYRLTNAADVRLVVYDVMGRRVRQLESGVKSVGWHRIAWDGRDEAGRVLASGVYYGRLERAGSSRVLGWTRITLLR